MKVVYVAGPFRGKSHWDIAENIRTAERLALQVWKSGMVAICPHLNTAHFQDELPDMTWLNGDLELLLRSDAMILTENWKQSAGAEAERNFAFDHKIPVFTSILDLQVWLSCQD